MCLVLRLVTVVSSAAVHIHGARVPRRTENGAGQLTWECNVVCSRVHGRSLRSQTRREKPEVFQKLEQGWTRHAKARMNVPLTVGAGGGFCSAHSAFLLSVSVMGGFGFVFGTYWSMCFEP